MSSLNVATLTVTSAGLTNATYADGEQLGTLITATMASATGIILGAVLIDAANVIGPVDAFLYDRSISIAADNAADAISDADALFKIGLIQFGTPTTQTNNRSAHVDSLAIPYVANASSQIFLQLVTRSANAAIPTSTALSVKLLYSKDV